MTCPLKDNFTQCTHRNRRDDNSFIKLKLLSLNTHFLLHISILISKNHQSQSQLHHCENYDHNDQSLAQPDKDLIDHKVRLCIQVLIIAYFMSQAFRMNYLKNHFTDNQNTFEAYQKVEKLGHEFIILNLTDVENYIVHGQ